MTTTHKFPPQIELAVAHVADQYEAGIAVDEITFFDCAVRSPQDECMPDEFHCSINRACVFQDQTCDFADDCGDYTDEVLEACNAYIRTSFENPEEPFGFLAQERKLISCSHCQELGQLADLAPDWLFTLM